MAKTQRNKPGVVQAEIPVPGVGSTPVLSDDRTKCMIDDLTLIVGSTIDYKPAGEIRSSIGKINSFMYAGHQQLDKQSVWMYISDLGKQADNEWVSVRVWKQQFDENQFQPLQNESTEQQITGKRPF